jgi:AraC-like DNA-binding protein
LLHLLRAVALTGYIETAFYVGLDPYALMRRHQITPHMLDDPENRMPAKTVIDLVEESARLSGCAHFGLLMAECRTFSNLGPVSLLLEHLGSMDAVIEALNEYRRHLNDITVLNDESANDEEERIVRVELMPPYSAPQACAYAVAVTLSVLTGASRRQWQPTAVHFTQTEPDDSSYYHRFFPVPVIFKSSFNGLVGPMDRRPWPWANDAMALHARRLLKLVGLHPEASPFSDSVSRTITLLLPSGRANLRNVAANLGVSSRALQRHLEDEGRGFADLLNSLRRELAVSYLSHGSRSITSIAELLGYSTSSSFTRWFASEFGVSPRDWRAEQFRAAGRRRQGLTATSISSHPNQP